jgi:hypothetical protein
MNIPHPSDAMYTALFVLPRYMEEYIRIDLYKYMCMYLAMSLLEAICWFPRHLPNAGTWPTPIGTTSIVLRERLGGL